MSAKQDEHATAKSATILSRLVKPVAGVLFMAAVWFGGGAIAEFLQPWRFADAEQCIGTDHDKGAYRNACDRDINVGWCVDAAPADGKACASETLSPDALSRTWVGTLSAGKGHPEWRHACNAPYLPAWITDPNKSTRKKNGCTRIQDEAPAA